MKTLVIALSFAAFAVPALAQDQAPPQQNSMRSMFMDACGADIKNFCGSAQSREDRRACVMQNKDKFSDSCKSFMASHPMHHENQMQGGQQQGPG